MDCNDKKAGGLALRRVGLRFSVMIIRYFGNENSQVTRFHKRETNDLTRDDLMLLRGKIVNREVGCGVGTAGAID